jgi:hypothetical protein
VALSSGEEPGKAKESQVRVPEAYERRPPRSSEPRGTLERAERSHRLRECLDMPLHFVRARPAREIEADHLEGPLGCQSARAEELGRLTDLIQTSLSLADSSIPAINAQLNELAAMGLDNLELEGPLVYSCAASCSPNFDDAWVVFAATLVMPDGLGCTIWGAEEYAAPHRGRGGPDDHAATSRAPPGRRACRQTRPGAEGHQQRFSKVTEVKNDSLCNEPWKQGVFTLTFFTKRRGRDSFEPVFRSRGFSAIPDAISMPVNDL